MIPQLLNDRINILIDDLIEDGGVSCASIASILVAAHEAAERGYDVALCRRVWVASNELAAAGFGAAPAAAGMQDPLRH